MQEPTGLQAVVITGASSGIGPVTAREAAHPVASRLGAAARQVRDRGVLALGAVGMTGKGALAATPPKRSTLTPEAASGAEAANAKTP